MNDSVEVRRFIKNTYLEGDEFELVFHESLTLQEINVEGDTRAAYINDNQTRGKLVK